MNQQVLEAKKKTVAEIDENLKGAQSFTVVSYQGLTVAELQELRRSLESAKSTFVVYKNTMVRRALDDA
jgi:large subunit ribosomal protein L10